jgi:hypothetical protein
MTPRPMARRRVAAARRPGSGARAWRRAVRRPSPRRPRGRLARGGSVINYKSSLNIKRLPTSTERAQRSIRSYLLLSTLR